MSTDSLQLLLDAKDRPGTNIDIDAHQLGVTLPAADREDLRKLNTKSEVRTWTLRKAEEHERLLLVYRSMHNTTVILSSTFPTELLSLIFAFAAATDELGTEGRIALRLLRVCRRWREVALGCSEIWANALDTGMFHMGEIGVNNADTDDEDDTDDDDEDGDEDEDDKNQATREEMKWRRQEYEYFLFALKLSAPRQLGFHISSFPQHFLSTTLPQNASRISSMTIKITSKEVFEQLYYILKNGMPVLCDLACPVVAKGSRLWTTLLHNTYTSPIDSTSLPRLQGVRTAASLFPALVVPSLRDIELNLRCHDLRVFTALRGALARCYAIDRLVLNRVLPQYEQLPTNWPGPPLPSVDELAVRDDPHLVCAAFKTRAIPGCKKLLVHTTVFSRTPFGISDLLPVDPADLRAILATADRMDILYSGIFPGLWSGRTQVVEMRLGAYPVFTADFVSLLRPFAAITDLHLGDWQLGSEPVHPVFFRAFPKLTTLRISGPASNQFLVALSADDSDTQPDSVVSPSLSRLDIIFGHHTALAAGQELRNPIQAEWVAKIMADFSLLVKVLELRSTRGTRLQHLGWSEKLGSVVDEHVLDICLSPLRELPGLAPEATAPLEALVDGTVNIGDVRSTHV